MTVEPVERVGVYGGTWRGVLLGLSEPGYIYSHCQSENLVKWHTHWSGAAGTDEMYANVAEDFEVNADATEFTFHLREGMRWSDGEPFTADDIVFTFEDVLLNEEIFGSPPALVQSKDGPARVERHDEHTVTIVFPTPAGLFLQTLAHPSGHLLTHFPRHYLERFHRDHNPDVDQLVEEEGAADWVELFTNKCGPGSNWGENPDLPTLGAWRLVTPFGKGQQVTLERNPYYWKVDPDGSQLPYIDEVVFEIVNDLEVMLLKGSNGELSIEVPLKPRFTSPANKPILAASRADGDYRFIDGSASRMNLTLIQFNLTHNETSKREIFQNLDFRIGLSHAINRREIIDVAMQKQGEPYQAGPVPDSPFYHERLATQYLEYDIGLANEYLDKAFPRKDANGRRLGPNGSPIRFNIEFAGEFRPEWVGTLELVRDYWHDVGIQADLKNEDRSLFVERTAANEHDVAVWHGDDGLAVMLVPHYFGPFTAGGGDLRYAVPWVNWYLDGAEPKEEPPASIRAQMELFDEIRSTADPEEQSALMMDLLNTSAEQFYVIGVAREIEKYFIAANHFRNVPELIIEGWAWGTPGPARPEQFFIEQ